MAKIACTAGPRAGETLDLNLPLLTVGRNPEAHLFLDDALVSTQHAELRFEGGGWELVDLGSSNGTLHNDVRIERVSLTPGDLVQIGESCFVFQDEEDSSAAADFEPEKFPAQLDTNDDELALVEKMRCLADRIRAEVGKVIIGQRDVLDQILMCILANGHALLIGLPGMAKTLTVRTIAQVLNLQFKRVQFTPDLMPGDIIGTDVLETNQATGQKEFRFIRGPIPRRPCWRRCRRKW